MVTKISILVSACIVISSLISAYTVMYRQESLYQNERGEQELSLARFYSQLIKADLKNEKFDYINDELGKLAKVEGIADIAVTDNRGRTIFETKNYWDASFLTGRTFKYMGKTGGGLVLRVNDATPEDNTGTLKVSVKGKTFDLAAGGGWQPAGVTVAPGEIFTVRAAGAWQEGRTQRAYDPDGLNIKTLCYHDAYPEWTDYALLIRVDDGGPETANVTAADASPFSAQEIKSIKLDITDEGRKVGLFNLSWFVKNSLDRERERRVVQMADALKPGITEKLINMGYTDLNYYVKETTSDQKDFRYGAILDQDNNVIFHTDQKFEGKKLDDPAGMAAYNAVLSGISPYIQTLTDPKTKVKYIDVASAVTDNDKLIGIIRLGYLKASVDQAVRREKINQLLLVFMLVLFGASVSVVIATRIAKPILQLAGIARQVGRGDLEVRADIRTGGEEIRRLADSFNDMIAGLKERDFVKDTFSRYVTKQVADEILRDPARIAPGGKKQQVTILFSDIRGFTTFAESHQPEEVLAHLNEYLSAMVDVIFKYEGTLDKYIGDAIMAVFGSPFAHDDDPLRAVKTALEMKERLGGLNKHWETEGKPPLSIGIGINTGEVICGNIGDIRRMEYTVIGDSVNIASRIEGLTKSYDCPVIISASTYEKVSGAVEVRKLGAAAVKGKTQSVELYELIAMKK